MKYMAMFVIAVVAGMMVSCGGDGDDDGGGSGSLDITKLIGKTFTKKDASYGTTDGAQKFYEVEFKNERLATVHMYGRDLGDYGYERWDWGTINCTFSVSGNTITIPYQNDQFQETIVMVCKNNMPEGWELTNDKGYSGGTTEWLTPGYYFCQEVSQTYASVRDMAAMGDKNGITRMFNNEACVDNCVIRVTEGNQLGVMDAQVTLSKPTDKDAIFLTSVMVSTYTLYYTTYDGWYVVGTSDWSEWKNRWTFSGTTLTDSYGHVYKRVK